MLEWSRIVGFDWDAGNARKNADGHRVTQAGAEQTFFNEQLIVLSDAPHSTAEARFHALGKTTAQRRLHIRCTLRQAETLIRVISARDMSVKERIVYGQ